MTHKRHIETRKTLAAAIALGSLALTGCQSVMPIQANNPARAGTLVLNEFPLRFKSHGFEAYCYQTFRCSVIYKGNYQINIDSSQNLPQPPGPDHKKKWGSALEIGIPNFPPAAEVKWVSADGTALEAEVDLGRIFADQKILHRVLPSDIPEGALIGDPNIFLEVNDRTINVYMMAFIPTKDEQIAGNRYSHFRDDLILAWSKTY